MEPSVDVVELISTLLDSGKYKEALSVPNEQKYSNSFKDSCWDLISVIVGKLQDDTIIVKPSLYGACEQLLAIIVETCTPEEALLELIEQVEVAKNDAQFALILVPLQQILKKLTVKRGRSLEWCLNSISTYIENIPTLEHHLEGKERLLMDCDANTRRITKVYSLLPPFYSPFIKELEVSDSNIKTKQIITAFLVSLLGKPLINIDLDPDSNAESEARLCCTNIIQDICILEKNVFKLIECINTCKKENQKSGSKASAYNDEEISPYEHREKINMTTLAGLAYTLFSGHFSISAVAIPQVYSMEYTVHTLLLPVVHLLSFTDYGPLTKGIALCKAILDRLPENTAHILLTCSVHFDLCKNLTNVAVYSIYEPVRKDAVKLIGLHINKFSFKGRITLIKYLIDTANHSGMIGYAITLYKNTLDLSLKDDVLDDCFKEAQLMNMIKKICCLPHGAESDMVELADQIITALNFLRYLALKDSENKTGIREHFGFIESDYLEKLRTGLNMSKAHYEEKRKEIDEGKGLSEDKINLSVNIGGNILDNIPIENKKEIINSALNAFHLIEGLIARLSECININKMQALTMDCQ